MKVAKDRDALAEAVATAQHEAKTAFGDDSVYLERYLGQPRHIEIQVIADAHGTVVYLGERDCTLQRRHQKIVEETPSPAVTEALRAQMTEAALAAARAVDYVSAGTVEFLLDDAGRFYFLEMNTRLQVEHPVTELVTGIDLVHAQLRVAEGEPLWFTQTDISQSGHAIECRVYAEDASRGLLPQTGTLFRYREPSGDGVRVDSGVAEGQAIGVDYDPMLAKVIVHAATRDAALSRMDAALRDFVALGVRHNVPFLLKLIALDDVRANRVDTGLIERRLAELSAAPDEALTRAADAVAKSGLVQAAMPAALGTSRSKGRDPWETITW
jgi:acetyl/propionyl-CoA carboxylase alpha subunit